MLTWHHRLSHLGIRGLQDLKRQGKISITMDNSDEIMRCEECIKGKLNRLNIKSRSGYKVDRVLGRVHSDLCELPTTSQEGLKYIMTFIDEHSHYATLYFMKSKDAFENLKRYVMMAERETCETVACIRSDNGGEYMSAVWDSFCQERGIKHSMGPPHSPQLNGVAERFNCTLLDRILPNLFKSNLPVRFWTDAARHAVQSINLSPSRALSRNECPKGLWKDQKLLYTGLKSFGCKTWGRLTGPQPQDKLSEKARPCLHLYTLSDGDGWMLWDLSLQRAVKLRDVIFHEDLFPGLGSVGRKTTEDLEVWKDSIV